MPGEERSTRTIDRAPGRPAPPGSRARHGRLTPAHRVMGGIAGLHQELGTKLELPLGRQRSTPHDAAECPLDGFDGDLRMTPRKARWTASTAISSDPEIRYARLNTRPSYRRYKAPKAPPSPAAAARASP